MTNQSSLTFATVKVSNIADVTKCIFLAVSKPAGA